MRLWMLVLFFSMASFAWAEKYKVIQVKGTVIVKRTGTPLRLSDMFDIGDALEFRDPDALVIAFSPTNGRVTLSANGNRFLASSSGSESRRDNDSILRVFDARVIRQYLILGETREVLTSSNIEDTASFFQIKFNYNKRPHKRRIPYDFKTKTLTLSRDILFGKNIPPYEATEIKFSFLDMDEGRINNCHFLPFFPDEAEFKANMQNFIKAHKNEKDIFEKLLAHVQATYMCTVNRSDLQKWLSNNALL